MIVPNIRIRSIELDDMASIEAFRRDIVAVALQARDMILGPHRFVADDLFAAIEAINTMIRTHSSFLIGNWVTVYVRPVGGQPQLLTTYAIREVSSEPLCCFVVTFVKADDVFFYRSPAGDRKRPCPSHGLCEDASFFQPLLVG